MAGNKYLAVNTNGETYEVVASQSGGSAGNIIALNSGGTLDSSYLPPGVELETISVPTSENLTAGNFVNLYSATGTLTGRKADNSNSRNAHGFVLAGTTSPAAATVYVKGENNQCTGLTVGTRSFLGIAGGVVTVVPGAATLLQYLGIPDSTTSIYFLPREYIVRA